MAETTKRWQIIEAINAERDRQDAKWGGPEHDDEHGPADWAALIFDRANRAMKVTGPHVALPVTASGYRQYLIEIAALAVAAIEAYDRTHDEG